MTNPNAPSDTNATRRQRLADVMAGYECGPYDVSGPGTNFLHKPADGGALGRLVLVSDVPRHGYFLTVCQTLADVEQEAANDISAGRNPVCYFDLDDLAGDLRELDEGDEVRHRGDVLHVVAVEYDPTNGRRQIVLGLDPDADADDPTVIRLDEQGDREHYEVAVRINDDGRMPVRYGIAKIVTTVAFNTVPSP